MAKKRQQPSRDEIERQAALELNRSMQRAMGAQQSSIHSGPPGSPQFPPAPTPAWGDQGADDPDEAETQPGQYQMSAAEEEEAVTEMAIQQMAERWGGRGAAALEDHIISRVNPSEAEAARDRALRDALARQARFAKPARRMPVPQQSNRGFSGNWTSSSPSADSTEPMLWESAVPTGLRAERTPVGRKADGPPAPPVNQAAAGDDAPARSEGKAGGGGRSSATRSSATRAPAKKAAAKKAQAGKAPVKRATAKKATAGKAPAKRAPASTAPAKRAPAKKAPAGKAPAKKATAGKAPAKRAQASKAPAKKAPAGKAPAKRAQAGKAPAKKAPAKRTSPIKGRRR